MATQYARDVVSGKIIACQWVRLSCQRHINDLARARAGGPYVYDEGRANHACRFIESLPHTKGDWAARGENLVLSAFQVFKTCMIFGWLKRASRFRRFRIAYCSEPRKSGKSPWAAAVGIYMMAADGEFGAEVYTGAGTEKQAWEVFRPAKFMAERTPELCQAFGIEVAAKSIYVPKNGSRFEPVIGKPGDGASVHCGIADEYHEHLDDSLIDCYNTGMGARNQPLLLIVTTSGDNLAGPCKAFEDGCKEVLKGVFERDELFALIYTLDQDDDWTSEEALRKANPNFDVSVSGEYLRSEQRAAIQNPRKQGIFKTKHLNIWVGANNAYFNSQLWIQLGKDGLNPDDFRGCPCCVGLDLSSKRDITSRILLFRRMENNRDHYYVFGRHYLPLARASMPEFQHYQGWVAQKRLKTTPGARINFDIIEADTIDDIRKYKAQFLGFDPWNAEQMAGRIAKATPAKAIEVPQQTKYLSEPMQTIDALIADGCIHHDGDPILTWAISNVVAHPDKNDNVFPNKSRDESKIDPACALITAMYVAGSLDDNPRGGASVYESRGMYTF